jgi:hypothetical protein
VAGKIWTVGVQQFVKGRKELDLWKIRYTDSKNVTTPPVDLSLAAWGEMVYQQLKMLHKEAAAAAGATAAQEKITWLVSGATVILNFCKKSTPRMGPATAACKKREVKSFLWNWTAFMMKPQEGMGKLFAS